MNATRREATAIPRVDRRVAGHRIAVPPASVISPPPRVTFRRVAVSLQGTGQSPVLPSACCVGSMRSDGRCGRCSLWRCFRVSGAQ